MKQLLCIAVLCTLASGCRLFHYAAQTTVIEPLQYSNCAYDKVASLHFRQLAKCALKEATALARAELDNYEIEPFSVDHRRGFEDGFVEYLEAGGTGQPPPLPPRRYWKAKYQTPAGYRAVQDWFRGYQHGAMLAQASGYRSLVTIPVSDMLVSSTQPYPFGRLGATEQPGELNPETVARAESEGPDERPPLLTRIPPVPEIEPTSD